MTTTTNLPITRSLIHQVTKAAASQSEREVRTWISRPMWEAFMLEVGTPISEIGKPWQGDKTRMVYGSETIIVESGGFWSFSRRGN